MSGQSPRSPRAACFIFLRPSSVSGRRRSSLPVRAKSSRSSAMAWRIRSSRMVSPREHLIEAEATGGEEIKDNKDCKDNKGSRSSSLVSLLSLPSLVFSPLVLVVDPRGFLQVLVLGELLGGEDRRELRVELLVGGADVVANPVDRHHGLADRAGFG